MPIEVLESYKPDISEDQANWWLQGLGAQDKDNEIIGLTIMTLYRKPATMFDVGSGTGCMVNVWRANGIEAYGVDRLPRQAWPHLFTADLTKPFRVNMQFDFVSCIEVSEHLPESAAETLLDTIYLLMKPRGMLFFTSAQPGQRGEGHINMQFAEYWRERLDKRGVIYRDCATFRTMLALRAMDHPQRHIEANLQMFQKQDEQIS